MLISQMLARAAQIRGTERALACAGTHYSWVELANRAARIAGGLRRLGLQTGDRVAILSRNNVAFHDAYTALPWAGCIMTCLNIRWTLPELADAINDSGARALVVDDLFRDQGEALVAECRALSVLIACGEKPASIHWETLATQGPPVEAHEGDMQDVAHIFYTGGTTGRSKGVMITHLNFVSAALARLSTGGFDENSSTIVSVPLFHVGGAAFVGASLAAGGHIHLLPSFDPASSMAAIEEAGATHVGWVPTMLSTVLDYPEFARFNLHTLRRIVYGGAPMPPVLLARAAVQLPGAEFVQFYGMTETAAAGCYLSAADHRDAEKRNSIGRAWPGIELKVMEANGKAASVGEVGEIWLRGPAVMHGYWGRPAETAEALADGWMHTGDAGYLTSQGYVYLVDRLKDVIITGGENVYSTEVENILLAHPAVRECAVIGLQDIHWGEIVSAVIYVDPDIPVEATELQDHCRKAIAGYKIPRRIFIQDQPLPKSAAGKILKIDLRKRYTTIHSESAQFLQ